MQTCSHCQQELSLDAFPPSSRGRKGAWCRSCHREKVCGPPTLRACDWCGNTLVVTARRAAEARVFCSRSCKDAAKDRTRQDSVNEQKPARVCPCGTEIPKTMRADAQFCSELCRGRSASVRTQAIRRARQRGADAEFVDRNEIYDRDGGRCHFCGLSVARHDFHLDHLIPIAMGGATVAANLAVAHPECNKASGAGRLPAQLRLVG